MDRFEIHGLHFPTDMNENILFTKKKIEIEQKNTEQIQNDSSYF